MNTLDVDFGERRQRRVVVPSSSSSSQQRHPLRCATRYNVVNPQYTPQYTPEFMGPAPIGVTPRRPNLLDNAFDAADAPDLPLSAPSKDVTLGSFLVCVLTTTVELLPLPPALPAEVNVYHLRLDNGAEFSFSMTNTDPAQSAFWLEALYQQCLRRKTDRAASARRALDWVHARFAPCLITEAQNELLGQMSQRIADASSIKEMRTCSAYYKVGAVHYLNELVALLTPADALEIIQRHHYACNNNLGEAIFYALAESRLGLYKLMHVVRNMESPPTTFPANLLAQSILFGYADGIELALVHGQVPSEAVLQYAYSVECTNDVRQLLKEHGFFLPEEEEKEGEANTMMTA